MSEPSGGLILICNDLGEVEQVLLDELGLLTTPKTVSGRAIFLRLVARESLEQARAFLTDLRINRKVSDRELTIQTDQGMLTIIFAGFKTTSHFVLVAAHTVGQREALLAQGLAALESLSSEPERKPRLAVPVPQAEPALARTKPVRRARRSASAKRTKTSLASGPDELERVQRDLYELALTDSLTGLYNRRHFLERMSQEMREAERYKRNFAFLVVDIDNFQTINALYGLAAGDSLLRSAAQILQQTLRKADILGRLGGDEFGALLLETTPETSIQAAHRLHARFDDLRLDGQTQALSVTVSIALVDVTEAVPIEHLLQKAEDLLKQAKAAGGNQIIKK